MDTYYLSAVGSILCQGKPAWPLNKCLYCLGESRFPFLVGMFVALIVDLTIWLSGDHSINPFQTSCPL